MAFIYINVTQSPKQKDKHLRRKAKSHPLSFFTGQKDHCIVPRLISSYYLKVLTSHVEDRKVTGPRLHLWKDRQRIFKKEGALIDVVLGTWGEGCDGGNDIWHFSVHKEGNLTGKAVVVTF